MPIGGDLDRVGAGFAGSDANYVLKMTDKNLAVTDLANSSSLSDGFNGFVQVAISDHDFQLHFRKKIDGVLSATVSLFVTALAAESSYFSNGHPLNADFGKGVLDFFQFEVADNRLNLLHDLPFVSCTSLNVG